MSDERLFEIESIPEVPLFREPRRSRGEHDARFRNDYPPDWHRCQRCGGTGRLPAIAFADAAKPRDERKIVGDCPCSTCLGMGSLKARVRLEAGHRCVRCLHPYVPKGDARMLGIEPTPYRWSPCDERCSHSGPLALDEDGGGRVDEILRSAGDAVRWGSVVYAEWRILTVHHLSGDKSDCRWGNLAALCQRCHLEIQAKVVLERVYPHEHSDWFKPHAAWWYALSYLDEDLTRVQVMERLDELLALERII